MYIFGREVSNASVGQLASNANFVEHHLDDGVIVLGKHIVYGPDLADSTSGIPANISVSE